MVLTVKRLKAKLKTKGFYYLRCGAKTVTFMFWATLYMVVMKMTIFKSSANTPVVRDWSIVPDNYTKWLVSGMDAPRIFYNQQGNCNMLFLVAPLYHC